MFTIIKNWRMKAETDLEAILNPFQKVYTRLENFIGHHRQLVEGKNARITSLTSEVKDHVKDIIKAANIQEQIKKLTQG